MKKVLFLGALVIVFFAASARAGEVSVDVSASWGSHIGSSHARYRQAPPSYYQWRSGNFYRHRGSRAPYYRQRVYSSYYRQRSRSPYYYRPYTYYRFYTPPTYYYYGRGYYGYRRPYYRPRSGIRVRVEIGG